MQTMIDRNPKASRDQRRGFAFVELLLVVAVVAVVSACALRAMSQQHAAAERFDREISTFHFQDTAAWTLEELPNGDRAWVREI